MVTLNVGILVFDDVDILDFTGPFEVFALAQNLSSEQSELAPLFDVCLVSENDLSIKTRGGMRVEVDFAFKMSPLLNVLVVPGGQGTRREIDNENMRDWILDRSKEVQCLASVCTGSFLLAEAGLLNGKRATTHWLSLDRMKDSYPKVQVDYNSHVVRDGNIFTSAGISAGIDMALLVVEQLVAESVARKTAKQMEYPYPESNKRCI